MWEKRLIIDSKERQMLHCRYSVLVGSQIGDSAVMALFDLQLVVRMIEIVFVEELDVATLFKFTAITRHKLGGLVDETCKASALH